MSQNPFVENPYESPQVPAALVRRSRPMERGWLWFVTAFLIVDLPFAVLAAYVWFILVRDFAAGEWSLSDAGAVAGLVVVALMSLAFWSAIPLCVHEIFQSRRTH